ncbi:hypothetical protein FGO68_gene2552 [Halteria grandinella]|uniref:Uncharacterized protein n=1 Tax=Halteria grandinella TaxID=5974 RepID=A0A8J8T6X9_HALGN|nr:hypothetical protein FGO68_gene2552 [Halteria grandinella]
MDQSLIANLSPQQAGAVEELIFELEVEKLKNQKLKKEWQLKKQSYEDQISQLSQNGQVERQVLGKLENEIEILRGKLEAIMDIANGKEEENDKLTGELEEAMIDLEEVRKQLDEHKMVIQKLQSETQQAKQDMQSLISDRSQLRKSVEELQKRLEDSQKNRSADFEKTKSLLLSLQSSPLPNLPLSQLITSAIDALITPLEKCLQEDLSSLSERLSHSQSLLRKLKLNQSKLLMEREFYRQRCIPRLNQSMGNDNMVIRLVKSRQQSMGQDAYTVRQSVGMFKDDELLSIEEKTSEIKRRNNKSVDSNLLPMVNSIASSTKLRMPRPTISSDDSSDDNEKENIDANPLDIEANETLADARAIISFKQDKDFLGKVLDAQLRVNHIESKLIKEKVAQTDNKKGFDFASLLRNESSSKLSQCKIKKVQINE